MRIPRPLRAPLYRAFAAAVGADPAESERPASAYPTFDAFFTRSLRPGARRWPTRPDTAGSPVDGVVGRFGRVARGMALQAKGRAYSIAELLGSEREAARYEEGAFLTLYLAPRHYHRVHAPVGGPLISTRYIPGRLLPVNAPAVALVDRLFVTNERVVCALRPGARAAAVVAVGATNVGRISVPAAPGWDRRADAGATREHDPPIALSRGQELMVFHLGSTVVLLLEGYRLRPSLARGAEIRLGDPVADPA